MCCCDRLPSSLIQQEEEERETEHKPPSGTLLYVVSTRMQPVASSTVMYKRGQNGERAVDNTGWMDRWIHTRIEKRKERKWEDITRPSHVYSTSYSVIHVRPCKGPPLFIDETLFLSLLTLHWGWWWWCIRERVAQLSGGFRWVRTQIHVLLVCVCV